MEPERHSNSNICRDNTCLGFMHTNREGKKDTSHTKMGCLTNIPNWTADVNNLIFHNSNSTICK